MLQIGGNHQDNAEVKIHKKAEHKISPKKIFRRFDTTNAVCNSALEPNDWH
jgi:hypothetical protein